MCKPLKKMHADNLTDVIIRLYKIIEVNVIWISQSKAAVVGGFLMQIRWPQGSSLHR